MSREPEADFIRFRGKAINFNCIDFNNLNKGINFNNASDEFIQKLIKICEEEQERRKG